MNVLLTDRKLAKGVTPNLFEAVVTMTSDYYPFGMQMPGRQTQSEDYRYAYNGMEVDNEVSGNGNSYTTEFRQYDPRLGRWKSLDPLMKQFPWMSPYVAFDNNPVSFTDPYGLCSQSNDEPPSCRDKRKRDGSWRQGAECTDEMGTNYRYLGNDRWENRDESIRNRKLNHYSGISGRIIGMFQGDYYVEAQVARYQPGALGFQDEILGGHAYIVNGQAFWNKDVNETFHDLGFSIDKIEVTTLNDFMLSEISNVLNGIGSQDAIPDDHILLPDGESIAIVSWSGDVILEANVGRIGRFFRNLRRIGTGSRHVVYGMYRNGVPYIGKSVNIINRYRASLRMASRLRPIVSGIKDSKLIRAVERRFHDYLKNEKGIIIDNKIKPMNDVDYAKYLKDVDEVLQGFDWKSYIDDMFGL